MQVPKEFDKNILHQLLLAMISFLEGIIRWIDFYSIGSCKMCVHPVLISWKSHMLPRLWIFVPFKNAWVQWKCWPIAWLPMHVMRKIRWKKTQPLNVFYDLWKLFKTTLSLSMLDNYCEFIRWRWMDVKVYKACLFHWIICIIVETISLLLAKGNSLTKRNPKSIIFKAIANQSLEYIACIFWITKWQ